MKRTIISSLAIAIVGLPAVAQANVGRCHTVTLTLIHGRVCNATLPLSATVTQHTPPFLIQLHAGERLRITMHGHNLPVGHYVAASSDGPVLAKYPVDFSTVDLTDESGGNPLVDWSPLGMGKWSGPAEHPSVTVTVPRYHPRTPSRDAYGGSGAWVFYTQGGPSSGGPFRATLSITNR